MARAQVPKIFPKPHSLILHGGFWKGKTKIAYLENPNLKKNAFTLTINQELGIQISFSDKTGKHYAESTLAQIQAQATEDGLPCLSIEDTPDFPVRGFMLDISRGRVPKMRELFTLIDLLAALRYNQLQLYIEHTYAFKKHEKVWQHASPLTSEEIKQLDTYCLQNGIELVPNLNSFGHVERWLKHHEYQKFAECPNGFYHKIFKTQRPAGTFKASPETANFVGELYQEFLPNFTSPLFNIGGDEPWELGLGASKDHCKTYGKKTVYLEHMARLQKHAESCGKKIQFWSDVLLEESSPEEKDFCGFNIQTSIPLIWGYEKGHPFADACSKVAKNTKNFYLVPGTSTWLSLTGRLDNAFANISEATAAGFKYNATGILLCAWGDNGYHNAFSINLLPILACAAQTWNFMGSQTPDLLYGFEAFIGPRELATILFYAGRLDNFIYKKLTNKSLIRELFFAKPSQLKELLDGVSTREISATKQEIERILIAFSKMEIPQFLEEDCDNENKNPDDKPTRLNTFQTAIYAELALALEMSHLAICRAEAFIANKQDLLAEIEKEITGPICQKFSYVWKLRNREGGLKESIDIIHAIKE